MKRGQDEINIPTADNEKQGDLTNGQPVQGRE